MENIIIRIHGSEIEEGLEDLPSGTVIRAIPKEDRDPQIFFKLEQGDLEDDYYFPWAALEDVTVQQTSRHLAKRLATVEVLEVEIHLSELKHLARYLQTATDCSFRKAVTVAAKGLYELGGGK